MRQVFSSPRIENVEAVARMLEDAGIEVRVNHGRSYRGAIRGNFSYRDQGGGAPRPSVWVIRSDQQPEARRILREAGLLQSPARGGRFLPTAGAPSGDAHAAKPPGGGNRSRYGLLLAVAVIAALAMLAWRTGRDDRGTDPALAGGATPATPTASDLPAGPAAMPDITFLPEEAFALATPPALAATLLRAELAAAGATRACLAIDGVDPAPGLLQDFAVDGLDVVPASECRDDRLAVAVSDYRTDGSGSGTVQLAVGAGTPRTLPVRREGRDWQPADRP